MHVPHVYRENRVGIVLTRVVRARASGNSYFQGMGSEVRPYLRTKNPIRNRNITKRDMEILVHGILSTREYQQAMGKLSSLPACESAMCVLADRVHPIGLTRGGWR